MHLSRIVPYKLNLFDANAGTEKSNLARELNRFQQDLPGAAIVYE